MANVCVFCRHGSDAVGKPLPVAMRSGDTPVPIPNTTVKT